MGQSSFCQDVQDDHDSDPAKYVTLRLSWRQSGAFVNITDVQVTVVFGR